MAWRTTGIDENAGYTSGSLTLPITFTGWVRLITWPGYESVVGSYFVRTSTANHALQLHHYGGTNPTYHFCVYDPDLIRYDESGDPRTTNVWYHVAIIMRSGTSNNFEVYIDGTSKISGSYATGFSDLTGVRLGGASGGGDFQFIAARVWNAKELTATEIQIDAACLRPRVQLGSLWASYPLLEGGGVSAGTTIYDKSGNGRDLTVVGTTEYESESPPVGWGASPLWILAPPEAMVWYNHDGVKPWSSVWRSGRF